MWPPRGPPTPPFSPSQRLLEWLDAAELRIAEEFLVGGDLDMVQQQLAELKVPPCATPGCPKHPHSKHLEPQTS